MIKRAIDIALTVLGLAILAPVLLLIAIGVKLDSPGPVLYSQVRVGRRGCPFRVYKFRSMVADADKLGPPLTGAGDVRITRFGALLRRMRLDELPQLLNVVKGDMSLVGPRPEVPGIVERYTEEQQAVLQVRPGITGPTQLACLNEAEQFPPGVDRVEYYVRHLLKRKLDMDLEYVRISSVRRDLACVGQTLVILARSCAGPVEGLLRKAGRFGIDCLGVMAANVAAFPIRFEGTIPVSEFTHVLYGTPLTGAAYGLAFFLLRTYRGVWEYAGIEDFRRITKAVLLGGSLHALVVMLVGWRPYPRSVVVLTTVLAILVLSGVRGFTRSRYRVLAKPSGSQRRRRLVIVGADSPGEGIAREICGHPEVRYDLVGFVEDDGARQGETIHGFPVLGTTAELPTLVRVNRIDEAVIAIAGIANGELRRIGEACTRAGLPFRTLPSFTQLLSGEGKLRFLRKANADELLRRQARQIDRKRVEDLVRSKCVMVTGAGGSIGSELCRQILELGAGSLVMVDRAENALYDISLQIKERFPESQGIAALADIKHLPKMKELFERFRPEIVVHAAAYKHVPILEEHPTEAVMNNVVGTRRLLDMAMEFGTERFVFISTDKAVRPSSLMGATKRICEMYVAAVGRENGSQSNRILMVRFGNVLGSAGSVVPVFQRQAEEGGPITITDPEVSRYFMTIREAVGLVLESATIQGCGGAFVLDMGEPVKITELADDVVHSLGLAPSDVTRRFVGIRPGEKLHEMLWDEESEDVLPSGHPGILEVRQRFRSCEDARALVDALERLALSGNVSELLGRIQLAVPPYRPSEIASLPFRVPDPGATYRVLLVEDDVLLCDVIAEMLGDRFEVDRALSARDAVELAQKSPDLVLLDVRLPDMSGLELCRRFRREPEVRGAGIIVMTSHDDEETAVAALKSGADDYVTKPFRIHELVARIDSLLRRRAVARHSRSRAGSVETVDFCGSR